MTAKNSFTSEVERKHIALAKKMIGDKKLAMHSAMSSELVKSKTLIEFDEILDKYDYDKKGE